MDEVDPQRRPAVRLAVQEFIAQVAHPRSRAILTARPSAQAEAQPAGSRRGDVLPLDDKHRNTLIGNLYGYYEPQNVRQRSADLIQRLDASSPGVQRLAETPLLTTILTIIHRPGYELPYQRAEVYERAVETLLNETHHQEGGAVQADEAHKQDVALQRSRLGLIAFHLHQIGRGEQGLPENDLIEALLDGFPGGVEDVPARREQIRAFLYRVSQRGGLLDERDCAFAFRTHRSFQEFLAGWHLARQYAPYNLPRQGQFIQERLLDLTWEEPVRLAAGYLAIGGEAEVNQFVAMVAGLGETPAQRDHAAALAGLCLVDLPTHRVERALRERLAPAMLEVFRRNPPSLPLPLRDDLGRALGELRDPAEPARSFDPRLHPGGMPEMVDIPAGPFEMGTSREDAQWLKENQNTETWDAEKPAHAVVITQAYRIGRYPVTNREYRAFIEADGYNPDRPWWSAAGRTWRTGEWQSDFSVYGEKYAEQIKKWVQGRARRDQPAFWDDRRWNGDNLPVVGVCWFEAEAYANWLTRLVGPAQGRPKGWAFRLPSEAEWEKAARYAPPGAAADGQKRFWPWGDAWDETRCNSVEGEGALNRTSPVGLYPHGASPLGCLDLVGNVWEWCLDGWAADVYAQRAARRAETGQPPADPCQPFQAARGLRGGSWGNDRSLARCADRFGYVPDDFNYNLGFRLLLSPKRF